MKPATLLALPALALAAATPAKVEERQLGGLLDLDCVLEVLTVTSCFSIPANPTDPLPVTDLIGLLTCPLNIILRVGRCTLPLPLPVKN